jgi:hypothetical protein
VLGALRHSDAAWRPGTGAEAHPGVQRCTEPGCTEECSLEPKEEHSTELQRAQQTLQWKRDRVDRDGGHEANGVCGGDFFN